MSKKDIIGNWMDKLPKEFKKHGDKDKTYSKHLIKPCSMILSIGQSGSGKTNSVVDFLKRADGKFYEIIIYTGSSSDEPLYKFLHSNIDGLQLIDEIEKLPNIDNYKNTTDKNQEKLIVFDDSVLDDKKVLNVISKWFMCARKLGYTCIFLAQSYHSTPKFIRLNAHYLHLFKITDLRDANLILSKYCIDISKDKLLNMLKFATEDKGQFLNIAVNAPQNTKYKKNFLEILDPNLF